MSDKNFFSIGLRVDREIVDFLDKYHYGTRSEVVRNILYESIDPSTAFRRLLTSYRRGDIDHRTFIKRYIGLKNRCDEMLRKYSQLNHDLRNTNINEAIGKLRLEESGLTLDHF